MFVYYRNAVGGDPNDGLLLQNTELEYFYLITKGTAPYFDIRKFVPQTLACPLYSVLYYDEDGTTR